jgi:hypothetical protein
MASTPVQAGSSSGFPAPPGFSVFGQAPSPTTTDLNSPWTRSSLQAPAVSHTSGASFQMPPPPASSLTSNHSGMPTFQPLSWLNSMPQQQIQMPPQQHSHYPPPSHQQHPQQMAHGYHLGHPSTASSPAWFGQAERGAPLWPSASQPAAPISNQQQQQGSNGPSSFQPSMNFNAQWK